MPMLFCLPAGVARCKYSDNSKPLHTTLPNVGTTPYM